MTERIRSGRFPLIVHRFPLPKPGKPELRALSWLDEYDEIGLRVLVGRLAPAIAARCDPTVIFSYPLDQPPPGWSTEDYHGPAKRRRRRGEQFLASERCVALGVADIADYYATIVPETLTTQLTSMSAPWGAALALEGVLRTLPTSGGTRGVPMGFEGSCLLGNAYLLPADAALAAPLGLARYTDDTWLPLPNVHDWEPRLDAYRDVLSRLGLRVNEGKTKLYEKHWDDPWSVVNDGTLDSITAGDTRRVGADEARDLLEAEGADEQTNWNRVRFAFGSLRSVASTAGLDVLYEHPEIFDEEPVTVGNYLCSLARNGQTRKAIDQDWLVERAVCDRGQRGLAGRLHAARASAAVKVGKQHGRDLFELASRPEVTRQVPLGVWAAYAWGQSGDFKQVRAIEGAHAVGSFSLRRGFCLPLLRSQPGRRGRAGLRNLGRLEPDLAPTISAIESD